MLLLLPSQLSLSQCQLSQPTLLHSMVVSMVAITMDSTHTLMEPPTHMPMEDTHMPLLHMPLLSQQLKNKGPALAYQDTIKNAKPFEKMKKELGSFKDLSTISSPKKKCVQRGVVQESYNFPRSEMTVGCKVYFGGELIVEIY